METRQIERRYLSLSEAASYLGLSRKTLYAWAEKQGIPAYKVGRLWRFDKVELDDFVRGHSRNGFV
jgi:excisionase family DNA binding protein